MFAYQSATGKVFYTSQVGNKVYGGGAPFTAGDFSLLGNLPWKPGSLSVVTVAGAPAASRSCCS